MARSGAQTHGARLDGTTNWAVLTTGATLSFAFSSANNTHVMILINSLLIMFFMYIEARRYVFYDLWRAHIRLMETEFFAEMLTPGTLLHDEQWRQLLANDLLYPHFGVSLWQALGRRLQCNYFGFLPFSCSARYQGVYSPAVTPSSRRSAAPHRDWPAARLAGAADGRRF